MLREGDTGAISIPKSWGSSTDPEAWESVYWGSIPPRALPVRDLVPHLLD